MAAGAVGDDGLGPRHLVTRRVLILSLVLGLLVAAGLALLTHQTGGVSGNPGLGWLLGYAVVVAGLDRLPPIYVEHRHHATWLTPADVAIPVGLVVLGPLAFVGASMLAEVLLTLRLRAPPIKALFNLISMFGGFVTAAVVFAAIATDRAADPRTWLAAALGLAACSLWDVLATSSVLSIVEQERWRVQVRATAPPILLGALIATGFGLTALLLWIQHPLTLLLLVPVLGMLYLSSRSIAQQSSERQRFESLYHASSTLARLVSLPRMLGLIAAEARGFVTGSAAVCWLVRDDGTWSGLLVDDDGDRPLGSAAYAALAARIPAVISSGTEDGERVERLAGHHTLAASDRSLREVGLPDCQSLVWSFGRAEPVGSLVLVVLRDRAPDGQDMRRSGVLGAFAAHAGSVVANVELYEEVRRALASEVERNREKSEFVAAVSHELRTPLAAMLGSVQTIRRLAGRLSPTDTDRMIQIALAEGARLQRLIEDLLLVAAREHQHLRVDAGRVAVGELLATIDEQLAARTQGRLVVWVDPCLGEVLTDRDKLQRIVTNLIENAVKYAPDGPIEVAAAPESDGLMITVSDHGPGIPTPDRQRVFERFVQLDQSSTRRRGGTGLGLYLSRELAALVGGSLELGDAPGGGARFVLKVPGTAADARGVGTSDPPTAVRKRPAYLARQEG